MKLASLFTVVLLNMLLVFSAVSPVHAQPAQGDWVITGQVVAENETIALDGNLVVKSGGSLTLRNVILTVNSSDTAQYQISAEPGSSFCIYDSTIMPSDERYAPSFSINGAKFVMKDSEIRGIAAQGWESIKKKTRTDWGFSVSDVDAPLIEGNKITAVNMDKATLQFSNVRDAVINNNVIESEGKVNLHLRFDNLHNSVIMGNHLVVSFFRLERSWNNHIANNTVDVKGWSTVGLMITNGSGNNLIDNNTFNAVPEYGSICTAFRLVNTTFPNAFINNVIKGSSRPEGGAGFITGILISQASNAIIANNRFVDLPTGVSDLEAMQIYRSDSNLILNNHIEGANSGIILFASAGNSLMGNQVSKSGRGIGLYYSSDNNMVENNTLEDNFVNIVFDDAQNNTIRANTFGPYEQRQGYDDSDNLWSRNYWSDYTGKDRGDGTGDAPYSVSPQGADNEPLISKPSPAPALVPDLKPVPFKPFEWESFYFVDANGISVTPKGQIRDKVLKLRGNLTIEEGMSLTLENVTLTAVPGKLAGYAIFVKSGASLYIYGSKVICGERGPAIQIIVEKGGKFIIKDSELHNLGSPGTEVGPAIRILADGVVIENNIITGSKGVIADSNLRDIRIVNNTVSKCLNGIHSWSSVENCIIAGNKISEVVHGSIDLGGTVSNSTIAENTLSDVWGAITWPGETLGDNEILNYMGGFPSKLTFRYLRISPTEVVVGEPVTILADVRSQGEFEATGTVTLMVDGVKVESKSVKLAGVKSTTVDFTLVKDTAGVYKVEVDGLTGSFTVSPPVQPQRPAVRPPVRPQWPAMRPPFQPQNPAVRPPEVLPPAPESEKPPEELPQVPSAGQGLPTLLVGAIVVAIVVIVGGGIAYTLRRKKQKES